MSPRNPDDMPIQSQKRAPVGMFFGCGIAALIVIALGIWLIMQIINTVVDGTGVNDPEDNTTDTTGVQTATMAPDADDNTADTNGIPLPQANDGAAGNAGADALAEADSSSTGTDDAPNIVYVTETVSAQQP